MGDLAGLSTALLVFHVFSTASLGILIWRYRERFHGWFRQSARDQADTILHVGLIGIFANAMLQRATTTYSFTVQEEWRQAPITVATQPFHVTWALLFSAAFLWWACSEVFGTAAGRTWWGGIICTAACAGAAVSWRF
jgi:hypothetical protein